MMALVLALASCCTGQPPEAQLQIPPPRQPTLRLERAEPVWGGLSYSRENLDYYPGDDILFRVDLSGFDTSPQGLVRLNINAVVKDAGGKSCTSSSRSQTLITGGINQHCVTYLETGVLGKDTPPGNYTLTCTIQDNYTKDEVSFQRPLVVLKQKIHIREIAFTHDPERHLNAPPRLTIYENSFCWVVFDGVPLDANGRGSLECEVSLIDPESALLISRLTQNKLESSPPEPGQTCTTVVTGFAINGIARPGKYLLRYRVTDRVTNETITKDIPFLVDAP